MKIFEDGTDVVLDEDFLRQNDPVENQNYANQNHPNSTDSIVTDKATAVSWKLIYVVIVIILFVALIIIFVLLILKCRKKGDIDPEVGQIEVDKKDPEQIPNPVVPANLHSNPSVEQVVLQPDPKNPQIVVEPPPQIDISTDESKINSPKFAFIKDIAAPKVEGPQSIVVRAPTVNKPKKIVVVPPPQIELPTDESKIKLPEFKIIKDIAAPKIDPEVRPKEVDIKAPEVNKPTIVVVPLPQIELPIGEPQKPQKIKINSPRFAFIKDIKAPKIYPEVRPKEVDIKAPEVNKPKKIVVEPTIVVVPPPQIELPTDESKIKLPKFKIIEDIAAPKVNKPKKADIKAPIGVSSSTTPPKDNLKNNSTGVNKKVIRPVVDKSLLSVPSKARSLSLGSSKGGSPSSVSTSPRRNSLSGGPSSKPSLVEKEEVVLPLVETQDESSKVVFQDASAANSPVISQSFVPPVVVSPKGVPVNVGDLAPPVFHQIVPMQSAPLPKYPKYWIMSDSDDSDDCALMVYHQRAAVATIGYKNPLYKSEDYFLAETSDDFVKLIYQGCRINGMPDGTALERCEKFQNREFIYYAVFGPELTYTEITQVAKGKVFFLNCIFWEFDFTGLDGDNWIFKYCLFFNCNAPNGIKERNLCLKSYCITFGKDMDEGDKDPPLAIYKPGTPLTMYQDNRAIAKISRQVPLDRKIKYIEDNPDTQGSIDESGNRTSPASKGMAKKQII